MTLYHIHEIDAIDDNALLVVASTPKRAVQFWLDYYDMTKSNVEGLVAVYRCDHDLKTEGAIEWGSEGHMVVVDPKMIDEIMK